MPREDHQVGSPSSIKAHEKDRINPAYLNLNEVKQFQPEKGVIYIWAYTIERDLIIGIEEPWKYPQAFHGTNDQSINNIFKEKNSNEPQSKLQGLGHPTLAASFTEYGNAKEGQAFIAGELFYDELENTWIINNKSGRFHSVQKNISAIQELMDEVANKFKEVGLDVKIQILTKPLFNPAKMWKKATDHAKKRFSNDDIAVIQVEALRIILKHSNNFGISGQMKAMLIPIKETIESLASDIKEKLTVHDAKKVDAVFTQLKDVLDHLEKISEKLTDVDKHILQAIQNQMKHIDEETTQNRRVIQNDP